jgi:peptidyl-Asp metalloendopeptidase
MPKRKARRKNKAVAPRPRRRRLAMPIMLVVSLTAAAVALAQWASVRSSRQQGGRQTQAQVTPAGLNWDTPSKEYIYAGSRLIATEEGTSQAGGGEGGRVNVALASNGGVASASSTYDVGFPASSVINGDRRGLSWGSGGGWADATGSQYPDWIQVNFSGNKTIDEIDVFAIQDDYADPAEPTESMTFSSYGITDFSVEYWDGFNWITVPGGSIVGNNKVWRKFIFSNITTDRIRVHITNALYFSSRVIEVEAYTPANNGINVALASNGGVASASSAYDVGYPASSVINGDRKDLNWGSGGGWADGTGGQYPDWIQVTFNGSKIINRIDVFTIQDDYADPAEPTGSMTFSLYGITDFSVEYWDGFNWITVPGGSIVGNNNVWRRFTFSDVTTDKLRVNITNALLNSSRVTEVEAYQSQ